MSTLVLLEELGKTACRNFVFSSSATVYGVAPSPITEDSIENGEGALGGCPGRPHPALGGKCSGEREEGRGVCLL